MELYKQVEPKVKLIGTTVMFEENDINTLPGRMARKSYSSKGDDEKLTKRLLKSDPQHTTPFEFANWVFEIDGISRACMMQLDRHRHASFVQFSSRYVNSTEQGYVYNLYSYMTPEEAESRLSRDSEHNERCENAYKTAIISGVNKQDARKLLPVSKATGTVMSMNSLALRNLFKLRLDKHAEWEIRRMTRMMYDIVKKIAPLHFDEKRWYD